MPSVLANDIHIHYEIYGEGPPLLLITGFAQNHLAWKDCIPLLAKHFQVIAFDNRGSGQTDAPIESYSIKLFAEDTIALLDALEIESTHILSKSMGTLITQQLCLDHPDRVKRCVCCAPFAHFPPIARYYVKTQLKLISEGVPREKLMELAAAWLLSNSFIDTPGNVEQFLKEIRQDPYPMTMEGLVGQADALFSADLRSEIEKIAHHLLLLVGELDINTPVYCAKEIEKKASSCKMHIFKGKGHLFVYEIPEQVCKYALEFFFGPK